jgi:hypothetical protein
MFEMIQRVLNAILLLALLSLTAWASNAPAPTTADQLIDRIAQQEKQNMKMFDKYAPLVETYVQTYSGDRDLGRIPADDHYFLGRTSFKSKLQTDDFLAGQEKEQHSIFRTIIRNISDFTLRHHTGWVPLGFAQMAIIDPSGFDRAHYDFKFQRREFIGEVRCLVFDVLPRHNSGRGRFLGRIWVEERDYNIVRFNGTYVRPHQHTSFVHFDSWRVNVADKWLPAYIFGEEPAIQINGKMTALRSQTRLWGYEASEALANNGSASSFTAIDVDAKDAVNDQTDGALSPLGSERAWQRQAENNVLDRLQSTGVLDTPDSPVNKILETVANNLIVTNNIAIEPEIRCRVLLTAPIESFTIGHTIVLSRGLLDVLPDEASLAAVIGHELSHIVLAHDINTKFAFQDRLLFPDDATLQRLAMLRSAEDEAQADKKSIELLQHSPYADKLAGIGLFMKQLTAIHEQLPNLVRGRLGNSFVDPKAPRLPDLLAGSPELRTKDVQQIAALPLGARIALDPWSNRVELSKAKSVAPLNPHEKLPFQITPFFPYLTYADKGQPQPTDKPSGGGQ